MDDRILEKLIARLTVIFTPIAEKQFDAYAEKFTEKIENMVAQSTTKIIDTHCKPLSDKIHSVSEENKALKLKIDLIENQLRLDSLVIQGLPDSTYAEAASGLVLGQDQPEFLTASATLPTHTDTEGSVLTYLNDRLGLDVNKADIVSAYRIPRRKSGGHRPIIVRFATRRIRDMVYHARRQDKNARQSRNEPVYINEHLTKSNAELFARARSLVRDKKITRAWTAGGLVYIRRSEQAGDKPERVTCPSDLEKY